MPGEAMVFLGNKLWFFTERDTVFFVRVADFEKTTASQKVDLVIIKKGIKQGDARVLKTVSPIKAEILLPATEGLEVEKRFLIHDLKDFYFSALLLTLVFVSVYRLAYPYLFGMMIQPVSLVNAEDFSDSGNLQKFFSFDILFYVLIVGMLFSLFGVTSLVVYRLDWLEAWIGTDYSSILLIWLVGAFGFLFLTVLKFLAIRILAYLFDLGKLEFAHFFYLLRLIVFSVAALILVGAYFLINDYYGIKMALGVTMKGFFWFYILGITGLFLIMMNRLSFKKYHLFTYLCIAELVPFLIISKWIMGLGN
jgi:hypothetical protein